MAEGRTHEQIIQAEIVELLTQIEVLLGEVRDRIEGEQEVDRDRR